MSLFLTFSLDWKANVTVLPYLLVMSVQNFGTGNTNLDITCLLVTLVF